MKTNTPFKIQREPTVTIDRQVVHNPNKIATARSKIAKLRALASASSLTCLAGAY